MIKMNIRTNPRHDGHDEQRRKYELGILGKLKRFFIPPPCCRS